MRNLEVKILSPYAAQIYCRKQLRLGRKTVFTNGCFDLLHIGHIRYLNKARLKGDLLVVGLDTDAAVRKLKGNSRPITPLKERLRVIAALECVDIVTWFNGANPIPLIKKLKPLVLVKGGDWKVKDILGSSQVMSWGGKVFSLPYIKGKSTTKLLQKICHL